MTLGIAAAAAVILGGVAIGSGGGDDDGAPGAGSSEVSLETTSDTSAASSPATGPPTTEPPQGEDDPSAAAASNLDALAEQQSRRCPVDAAVVGTIAGELGGRLAGREIEPNRPQGSTFFRQRTTGAAAIVCSAVTREDGVALHVGPLGEASLRAWTAQALINDRARLRELDARGDATVFAVDSATEVGDFGMVQKGAAWTDGTLVVMLLGVVPIDEPIDTSAAVRNLRATSERGRSAEAMECPVSMGVLDAFNEPIGSTFIDRTLDDTSVMGAGVDLYQRRGRTLLRCTAGVENGLVALYLGTLQGADPGRWLSMTAPTLQYRQVGTDHEGTLLAVRLRHPGTSIRGAAWTDGDRIVMIVGVGSPDALDFSPDQAATGVDPALQAIVAELAKR